MEASTDENSVYLSKDTCTPSSEIDCRSPTEISSGCINYDTSNQSSSGETVCDRDDKGALLIGGSKTTV